MRFVVSGGGTAGHINPAIALAEALGELGHEVLYAGTPQGIEGRLVRAEGIPFTAFEASGFNRRHPATLVRALRLMSASTRKARAWFKEIRPDAVVCFGGYVCLPVGRAALAEGIPLIVHEQNSVMGLANAHLARRAALLALTYAEAAPKAPSCRVEVVGNPVRRQVLSASREAGRAYVGASEDATLLAVTGGSLGARHINAALARLKGRLLAHPELIVRHITGPRQYDEVAAQLQLTEEEARRWQLVAYEDRMGDVLAASDAVVSRAGATSLAEIAAVGVPALLVPFPYATADHQTSNAQALLRRGAAYMVRDDEVEGERFEELLMELVEHASVREAMRRAIAEMPQRDSAEKFARLCVEIAEGGR